MADRLIDQLDSLTGWQLDALCLEHPEIDWFADTRGSSVAVTAAKRLCARCLVQHECRAYAIAEDIRYGVWGGLAPSERKAA